MCRQGQCCRLGVRDAVWRLLIQPLPPLILQCLAQSCDWLGVSSASSCGVVFSCVFVVLQICEAFNANRYPFPEDPARQRQMHGEVK
jgi:hypothetical protein